MEAVRRAATIGSSPASSHASSLRGRSCARANAETAATPSSRRNRRFDTQEAVRYAQHVTLPIGILASGTGSNFEAIAAAIADGRLDAQIRILVCNRPGAPVLAKAAARGIATEVVDHRSYGSR